MWRASTSSVLPCVTCSRSWKNSSSGYGPLSVSVAASWAQRMLRVWRVFPPRQNLSAASTTSTDEPARRAAIAAQSAALPPPATSTSYFLVRSAISVRRR
jgi:hypothetical protein